MTPEQILADAESRLARHATNMAELLDGMESEDWGVYVESEEQFLAYPTRCTWLSPETFRIYLAEGDHCEYLDIHLRNWDDVRFVMYHLELLAGGADVLVRYDSDPYLFAMSTFKLVGDFTY
jgi:hypothetical protein